MNGEAKLTEIISARVSKGLKDMYDNLTDADKHDLNHRIRVEIARKIHETQFKPEVYLSE